VITPFLPVPVKDLILHFRTILNGFINFYSFAHNIKALFKIYNILSKSLKRTLCRKLSISQRERMHRFGPNTKIAILKRDGSTVFLDFS